MSPRLALRMMLRESRGARGRMVFFAACLAVGVAAVVSVAGMSASLEDGIRSEARQLLAADLAVSGRQPAPEDLSERLARLGAADSATLVETVTMAAAPGTPERPGASQLVEVKAVEGGYPFYGELRLAPDRPLGELLGPDAAVVAPDLLARLGLGVGDRLVVGGEALTIAGTVLGEPDRVSVGLAMGPRVFISLAALERAELVRPGSRVEYRTLVRLPAGAGADELAAAAATLREELPAYRVETWREAQPSLRQGVRRVDRFLGLVALLSLLVGGIGVAQTVRSWIAGRLDAIAVLKCLGVRPREVVGLYLGQTALLGLAGSAAGIVVGVAVQLALPYAFPDLIPERFLRPWQPQAILRGLALGLGVAVLFGLPPLAAVRRVPPARVLRRDAQPLPVARWAVGATAATLAAGVVGMAVLQSGSLLLGLQFAGGLVLAALLLAGAARLLVGAVGGLTRASRRLLPGRRGLWLRHGLTAVARPGAGTLSAIVALGLGTLVVLAMGLVERRLSAELDADLPAEAPSVFLVDVQPDQWPEVRRLLEAEGGEDVESVPVVMARLRAIEGAGVDELVEPAARDGAEDRARGRRPGGREGRGGDGGEEDDEDDDRRWAMTREQRLTYMEELPEDNVVVAGELWSDPARPEVSVEEDFADDLGVGLGDRLTFDVQGVPVDLWVTSVRTVDWGTFGINFFLVVEPGVLDDAPQQRLAVARLPRDREQALQDRLAAGFPNVTLLRLREILEKIVAVLDRIGLAVGFLGGFTVLAGVAILAGAVSAAAARRGREVALLKTLGFTRAGVAAAFAVEQAAIGLVAGTIGAAGGAVLAWAVLTRGMEIAWQPDPLPVALALAGTAVLTAAAGVAASARALTRRPIAVLREE